VQIGSKLQTNPYEGVACSTLPSEGPIQRAPRVKQQKWSWGESNPTGSGVEGAKSPGQNGCLSLQVQGQDTTRTQNYAPTTERGRGRTRSVDLLEEDDWSRIETDERWRTCGSFESFRPSGRLAFMSTPPEFHAEGRPRRPPRWAALVLAGARLVSITARIAVMRSESSRTTYTTTRTCYSSPGGNQQVCEDFEGTRDQLCRQHKSTGSSSSLLPQARSRLLLTPIVALWFGGRWVSPALVSLIR